MNLGVVLTAPSLKW